MSGASLWDANELVDNAIDCVSGVWFEVYTRSGINYRIKGVLEQDQYIDDQADSYIVQTRFQVSVKTTSLSFSPNGVYMRVDDDRFPQFKEQWYQVCQNQDNVNGRSTLTLVKSIDPPKQNPQNTSRSSRTAKYASGSSGTRTRRIRRL